MDETLHLRKNRVTALAKTLPDEGGAREAAAVVVRRGRPAKGVGRRGALAHPGVVQVQVSVARGGQPGALQQPGRRAHQLVVGRPRAAVDLAVVPPHYGFFITQLVCDCNGGGDQHRQYTANDCWGHSQYLREAAELTLCTFSY